MNNAMYGSIAVVGTVFALLELLLDDNLSAALTIILLTIYLIGLVFLSGEWRYYRRHNALLASFQFLFVPIILLLVGNVLAPNGYGQNFINFSIALFSGIEATSSLVSIILLIPAIIILQLTSRYYDGRYPGFVFRRRQFAPKFIPFLLHLLTVIALIAISNFVGTMDVISLLFVIGSLIQLVQKFIIPILQSRQSSNRQSDRRGFLNSILGSRSRGSRRQSGSNSPSARSDLTSSSSSRSPSRSSRRTRQIPTAPSNGYREVPTRSRSSSSTSRGSNGSSQRSSGTTPSRSVASVDSGVEMITPSKKRKVRSSKLSNYLPKGNYDASDLKCMVCYEDFKHPSNKNIVICPKCKFPAHEVEFKSWLNTSSRCPRCNQEIRNKRQLNSGLVSESQYAKFIKKL